MNFILFGTLLLSTFCSYDKTLSNTYCSVLNKITWLIQINDNMIVHVMPSAFRKKSPYYFEPSLPIFLSCTKLNILLSFTDVTPCHLVHMWILRSSWVWHAVTTILEELSACILRVCSLTMLPLKMEAVSCSKTLVNIYVSIWCQIPEDMNLLNTVTRISTLAINSWFLNLL
jgi:hypothetical protein